MVTISARIDKGLVEEIEKIVKEKGVDRSAVIRELLRIELREYKLRKALERKERKVTVWKSAEIAGLTYREKNTTFLFRLRWRN